MIRRYLQQVPHNKSLITLAVILAISIGSYYFGVLFERDGYSSFISMFQSSEEAEKRVDQIDRPDKKTPQKPRPSSTITDPNHQVDVVLDDTPMFASGTIAYIKDGDIWIVNADRSGNRAVLEDDQQKFHIAVSPDNTKIAYSFYPKDPDDRTNTGIYVGFNSGIGIVDINTGENTVVIPYGDIQNFYSQWSPDSRYISYWTGNGISASVLDIATGENIVTIPESSPIIFVEDFVSYISQSRLIRSNLVGSDKVILADQASGSEAAHESPNRPRPPYWFNNARYVAYYSDSDDLRVIDTVSDTNTVVIAGDFTTDSFRRTWPNARIIGYSPDFDQLLLRLTFDDYSGEDTVRYNLRTNLYEALAHFDGSALLSPSERYLVGVETINDVQSASLYDLSNSAFFLRNGECLTENYPKSYTNSVSYELPLHYTNWSPDSRSILSYTRDAILITNIEACESYFLLDDNMDRSAVWFP